MLNLLAWSQPEQLTPQEYFQHNAAAYVRYLQIFRNLEECYDAMVHPQKRQDVKEVLETVIRRVVVLKHRLVKWNPPNPDVGTMQTFPWEYVNLDDLLVDLKLPPETLEVPIPRYFTEDDDKRLGTRDKLVHGYTTLKLGVERVTLEEEGKEDDIGMDMTADEAIAIIQRNERGRQGTQRAAMTKEVREEEKMRRCVHRPRLRAACGLTTAHQHVQRRATGGHGARGGGVDDPAHVPRLREPEAGARGPGGGAGVHRDEGAARGGEQGVGQGGRGGSTAAEGNTGALHPRAHACVWVRLCGCVCVYTCERG